MYEIIYVCNSINNKNVREGELNILEKHENQLYFEFGSDKMNIKKRFYNDVETLNKDFDALLKLREKGNKKDLKGLEIKEVFFEEPVEIKEVNKKNKEQPKEEPKEKMTEKYKIIKRKK